MSNRHLFRKPPRLQKLGVDSAQTIEMGDMVFNNTNDLRSAAQFTYGSTLAITQENFAAKFLGVAMNSSVTGETADLTYRQEGIFEFDCASATFEMGDTVAIDDNAGGTALVPQQVIATGENGYGIIGRIAKRYGAATTRCLVEILKPKPAQTPVLIPIFQGLITTAIDLVTDWTPNFPFKLVALHSFVTVLTAGAASIVVHKAAQVLDDAHTIPDASAIGAWVRTDMTDATGDDLFVSGDTLSLLSDGTPTAGEALFLLEVKPLNMQIA